MLTLKYVSAVEFYKETFFFNRADILPLIVKFCHKTLKVVKNSHAAAEAALLRVHDHILAPPPVTNGDGLASWFS